MRLEKETRDGRYWHLHQLLSSIQQLPPHVWSRDGRPRIGDLSVDGGASDRHKPGSLIERKKTTPRRSFREAALVRLGRGRVRRPTFFEEA